MNQESFETQGAPRWAQMDAILTSLEARRPPEDAAALPGLYRQLCADVALAQHRMYSASLCAGLNARLIRTRNALTSGSGRRAAGFVQFLAQDFPAAVRREWRLVLLSMALFFIPVAGMIIAAHYEPRWIFSILSHEDMRMMDGMYGSDTAEEFIDNEFGSRFAMFGFYIQNNVSIGLRTVGAGLLFAAGAAAMTFHQGLMIGAMEGYVHYSGNVERFYTFVAGHSAFELGGLIICGAAGMRLGLSLIRPGRMSRAWALTAGGRQALPLIWGGALLIFLAAFVEAFWSAHPAPPVVKYAVGIGNVVLLVGYLIFSGRDGGRGQEGQP